MAASCLNWDTKHYTLTTLLAPLTPSKKGQSCGSSYYTPGTQTYTAITTPTITTTTYRILVCKWQIRRGPMGQRDQPYSWQWRGTGTLCLARHQWSSGMSCRHCRSHMGTSHDHSVKGKGRMRGWNARIVMYGDILMIILFLLFISLNLPHHVSQQCTEWFLHHHRSLAWSTQDPRSPCPSWWLWAFRAYQVDLVVKSPQLSSLV